MKKAVSKIVKHPAFSLIIGLILLFCGLVEAFETVIEHFEMKLIDGYHGIIVFGIGHSLIAFVHLIEGTEGIVLAKVEEDVEKKEIVNK